MKKIKYLLFIGVTIFVACSTDKPQYTQYDPSATEVIHIGITDVCLVQYGGIDHREVQIQCYAEKVIKGKGLKVNDRIYFRQYVLPYGEINMDSIRKRWCPNIYEVLLKPRGSGSIVRSDSIFIFREENVPSRSSHSLDSLLRETFFNPDEAVKEYKLIKISKVEKNR